jgi:hypothetical protein
VGQHRDLADRLEQPRSGGGDVDVQEPMAPLQREQLEREREGD